MNRPRIREILFLVVLGGLGLLAALQLVRSVPYATMLYLVGLSLLVMLLQPFAGLLVYLVFYYTKPHDLVPGFSDKPVILLIACGAFISMFVNRGVKEKSTEIIKGPQDYFVLWLIAAIFVSHAVHLRFADGVTSVYGFARTVVVYLLITNLVTSVRRLNVVVQLIGALTLWVAIEAIVTRHLGTSLGGIALTDARARVLGFSQDPNLLAGGLLLALPLFFLGAVNGENLRKRLYSTLGLVLVCYAVMLTNSRGGFVTLWVVGTLLLVRTLGRLRGGVVGLVLALAIYLLGPSRAHEITPYEVSAFGRLVVWSKAFGTFIADPLFGSGSVLPGSNLPGLAGETAPHSAFMQSAADMGLFGLFPWILLIVVSLRNVVFVGKHAVLEEQSRLRLLSEVVLYACVAWLVTHAFVGSPYYEELYVWTGLCLAATRLFVGTSRSRYRLIGKADLWLSVMAIVLGLGAYKLVAYILGA